MYRTYQREMVRLEASGAMRRRIVNCRWQSGERYVMLVEAETGQPLWWPMLYVTTQLRNAGQSVATMEAALRAIDLLLTYAQEYRMDLEERILTRQYLAIYEVDALCDWAQHAVDRSGPRSPRSTKQRAREVSKAHEYGRLSSIASYLEWLGAAVLGNRRTGDDDKEIARLVRAIRKRRPSWRRNRDRADRALGDEQRVRLLEVINPDHPDNPWKDPKAAERNELAVLMLLYLGMRRGELLGVQVGDIDWQAQKLSIERRPDEPDDPRMRQPRTKTLPHKVNLFPNLLERLDRYVRGARRKTRGAYGHRYLLVVHRKGPYEGDPLSEYGLTKVFSDLQKCDPLLEGLHPHALRHTWNLLYSRAADAKRKTEGLPEAAEDAGRNQQMGWEQGSAMARAYNRRHIERKAGETAVTLFKDVWPPAAARENDE